MKYLSPAEYLPHDAPMMLLETVESVTDNGAACSVTVSGHGVLAPFLNADGDLPGWFALDEALQTNKTQLAGPCPQWTVRETRVLAELHRWHESGMLA